MLQPARTKYRKLHKGRIRGKANKGASMAFGEYGLQATESGQLRRTVKKRDDDLRDKRS